MDRPKPNPPDAPELEEIQHRLRDSFELGAPSSRAEGMELVRRAQAGDRDAFELLVRTNQERLRRIIRIRLGSRLRARLESMDIVQEALLVASRKLAEAHFEKPQDVLHWLTTIAIHQIQDANRHWEAAKRQEAPVPPISKPSVGEQLARRELREIMDEAVEDLPADYREVILLRDYYGTEWDALAARLGKTEGAARELHRRAWIRLTVLVGPRVRGTRRDRD